MRHIPSWCWGQCRLQLLPKVRQMQFWCFPIMAKKQVQQQSSLEFGLLALLAKFPVFTLSESTWVNKAHELFIHPDKWYHWTKDRTVVWASALHSSRPTELSKPLDTMADSLLLSADLEETCLMERQNWPSILVQCKADSPFFYFKHKTELI